MSRSPEIGDFNRPQVYEDLAPPADLSPLDRVVIDPSEVSEARRAALARILLEASEGDALREETAYPGDRDLDARNDPIIEETK